ncbi:MAG TPA: ubiquinone/menaquinone biosynthesis methyltransferase, partial [bacterium]|nr:ubiquinone/menaquinone biosynthesis methyltransferase [bacterium]
DQIAQTYDRFNDLITQGQHRYWKRVLVRRLNLASQARGLDLCTGTGDIALRCLRGLGAGGGLVAADFSPGMLRIAQARLRRAQGVAGATGPAALVLCADAQALPLAPASLDFVTVGYGLRNVTDLRSCLREILRVLRPGGVLASLDVGKVGNPLLRPLAEFYLFRVVPRLGRLLQRGQDMFDYLPASTVEFPGQHALRTILLEEGFARAEVVEFLFGASVLHLAWKGGADAAAL